MNEFSGFEKPKQNWSKLPHAMIESLDSISSLAELKVILYVLRHTWGFQEFDEMKRITLDEFENGRKKRDGSRIDPGVGMSRNAIKDGISRAIKDGFLTQEKDGRDRGRSSHTYKLRMTNRGSKVDPQRSKVDSQASEVDPRSEKETEERNRVNNPATDVAGENEKSAKEFVGLFGENPSAETRDPPKNAEEFRERVMQAEVGWLAKAKNEPWLGWSDGRFRERDGVSVGAQERICALLEKHTGQKPVSDGQWKGWANTAVEVYNASTGRWDAVERGIRDAGAREARYVPNIASRRGDVNGWASAVSKALSEIEGERILMEI